MRAFFTVLLVGCGLASVYASRADAQAPGVVYVGDLKSIDRAVLEAAELQLPSVKDLPGSTSALSAPKPPRIDRPTRSDSVMTRKSSAKTAPVVTASKRPTPRPAGSEAKASKPSFFSRMKPDWLFGKAEESQPAPKDPFATATQQARVQLTGAATKARAGVKPIPAFVEPKAKKNQPLIGVRKVPAVAKPSSAGPKRDSGIVQRSTATPRRGLLSGWFQEGANEKKGDSMPPAMTKSRGFSSGIAKALSPTASARTPSAKPLKAPQPLRVAQQAKPQSKPLPLAMAAGPKTAATKRLAPKPRAFAPRPALTKAPKPAVLRLDEPDDTAIFASDETDSVIASVRETVTAMPFEAMPVALPSGTAAAKPSAPKPAISVPTTTEEAVASEPAVVVTTPKAVPAAVPAPIVQLPAVEQEKAVFATDDVRPSPAATLPEPEAEIASEPYFATDLFERAEPSVVVSEAEPTQRSRDLLAEAHQIAAYAGSAEEFSSVVKRCRYVMAIDGSRQAQAYANQLAGWALTKRGDCFDDDGRQDEAEIDYLEALRCDAECWRAEHALGVLASRKGKVAEAQRHFDRTIDLNPEYAKAYSNRAALAIRRGDFHRALDDFQQAIEIDPDLSMAHNGRGRVCHMLGMFDEGLRHLDAAEILEPENASIAAGRADLLVDLGRYGQAAEAYARAIRLDPSSPSAYRNLAWMQATCPIDSVRDGVAALANAEQAERLGQADDLTLDTKAAALASLGRFDEASEVQRQAIEIAPSADAPAYAERLAMYEQGQAFTTQPIAVRQASYQSAVGPN